MMILGLAVELASFVNWPTFDSTHHTVKVRRWKVDFLSYVCLGKGEGIVIILCMEWEPFTYIIASYAKTNKISFFSKQRNLLY